jgi:hypothetical protein
MVSWQLTMSGGQGRTARRGDREIRSFLKLLKGTDSDIETRK